MFKQTKNVVQVSINKLQARDRLSAKKWPACAAHTISTVTEAETDVEFLRDLLHLVREQEKANIESDCGLNKVRYIKA